MNLELNEVTLQCVTDDALELAAGGGQAGYRDVLAMAVTISKGRNCY